MAFWFLRCPQPRLRRGAPVQFAVSQTWQHNRGGLARCQISGKKGKRVPRHSHRVHGGQSWKLPSLFSVRPRGFEDTWVTSQERQGGVWVPPENLEIFTTSKQTFLSNRVNVRFETSSSLGRCSYQALSLSVFQKKKKTYTSTKQNPNNL